jgi:phosphoglycerate dehydrogenase-like enzyme
MSQETSPSRVLICDAIGQVGIDMLEEKCRVDVKTGLNEEQLMEVIADYDAVVVRSATKITADVIEKARRLKVIGRAGAGLDNIATDKAKEKGITVVNSPDANSVAVAELTMSLILSLSRHIPRADQSMKDGKWAKKELMGIGLTGKTLGIIGMGRIGCELAKRAQAFGMKVVAYQRSVDPERYEQMCVRPIGLEALLKSADFVSLHVPKSNATNNLIGQKELSWMKPTAYLINTARGTVVDEPALLEALESGVIAGAGLDVYAKEPAVDSQLAKHPRVIATPHIAASTIDAQAAAATTVAEKIINALFAEPKFDNPLSLRVVDINDVVKHELIDPRRVEKLKATLSQAIVFTNPPIVAEDEDKYICLDGATRTTAMKELGFNHMIVQVISNLNDCTLDTWQHVIRKVEPRQIIDLLDAMPEITLVETPGGDVLEKMAEHGGLCYMITTNEKCYHIQPSPGVNHLDALNKLTNAYIEASVVTRTTQRDIGELLKAYPDMAALMVFPKYDPQQVVQIARSGRALPAGITRFLIPGRVMRLNAQMDVLKAGTTLQEKNQWLYEFTMDKLDYDKARLYQEPVYLLDE